MIFTTSPLCWATSIAVLATLANAAHLFGPRLFHIGGGKLGHFGPVGYGHFGDARMGHIGKLHYGQIGGVYGNSFVGAANPYADDGIAEPQRQMQPYAPSFLAEPNPGYAIEQGWNQQLRANEAERNWGGQPEMGAMWTADPINQQHQPFLNPQLGYENPMAMHYQPEYAQEPYWQ